MRNESDKLNIQWIQRLLEFQIIRFCMVSSLAISVDYGILYALVGVLPKNTFSLLVATAAGYIIGTLINFIIARCWVFQQTRFSLLSEFVFVFIIGLIGLFLTEYLMVKLNIDLGWSLMFAKGTAVITVFFWNFLGRRYLVYRPSTSC